MILTIFARFLSLPCVSNNSSRLAKCRPNPHDAQCTVARRTFFVRVDISAIPGDISKFKQIKLTIQRSIDDLAYSPGAKPLRIVFSQIALGSRKCNK